LAINHCSDLLFPFEPGYMLFQDPNVVVKGIERLETICRDLVQKTGKILRALAARMRNREKNSKRKGYFRHPLHFLIPLDFPAGYDLCQSRDTYRIIYAMRMATL